MAFAIHFNGVDDVVTVLAQITNDLQAELQDLESQVAGKLATWSGAAQTEYAICKADWDKTAESMQHSLGLSARTLGNVNDHMLTTERGVTSMWTRRP